MDIWGPKYCYSDEELVQSLKKAGHSDEEIEFIIREDDASEDGGDSTYRGSYRNVFYPSGFDAGVWDEIYDRDIGKYCPICKFKKLEPGQEFDVDHKVPVVEHFNKDGYKMSQWARRHWYNDRENLRLTHRSCNRENAKFTSNIWQIHPFSEGNTRANYNNIKSGIHATTKFLEQFFSNLLLGTKFELKNRYMHVDYVEKEKEKKTKCQIRHAKVPK